MYQPPGRHDVIMRIARNGGQIPDPARFAVAADRAASCRSASIVTVHTADTVIVIVTVDAPSWFAARAVARAVVSEALEVQGWSPSPSDSDARRRAGQRSSPLRLVRTSADLG